MNPMPNEIQSVVFVAKLAAAASIAAVGVALAVSDSTGFAILGIVMIGSMMAHAVELQHQCVHHTAFKRPVFNRIAGTLLGAPMFISFFKYRRDHLIHHRRLGTARDRAFFSYASSEELTWNSVALDFFGIRHIRAVLQEFGSCVRRAISKPSSLDRESAVPLVFGFLLTAAIAASIQFQTDVFFKLWFLPLLTVALPIHFLIELPEHLFCSTSTRDALQNTRTIVGSRLSRWFTNGNNFHVEHHLFPKAPFERLADISQSLNGRHAHLSQSYADFYGDVLDRLIAGRHAPSPSAAREVTT
jgi:fatty acid desaturase